jgi:hypothetical protein
MGGRVGPRAEHFVILSPDLSEDSIVNSIVEITIVTDMLQQQFYLQNYENVSNRQKHIAKVYEWFCLYMTRYIKQFSRETQMY